MKRRTRLVEVLPLFLDVLRSRGRAKGTIDEYERGLNAFVAWSVASGLAEVASITRADVLRYQAELVARGLSDQACARRFTQLLRLFRWLFQRGAISDVPLFADERPRLPKRLPKTPLTTREVERLLAAVDVDTPLGLRDRAVLEVLYSTAIRRAELLALDVADVDVERGLVHIRHGKGDKARFVPIGERALDWLRRYTAEVRAFCLAEPTEPALFLSSRYRRMSTNALHSLVQRAHAASKVSKRVTPHVFRHTAATLMLDNGADVRIVQEMLGHADLDSTMLYTHLSPRDLQSAHARSHPARELDASVSPPSAVRLPYFRLKSRPRTI